MDKFKILNFFIFPFFLIALSNVYSQESSSNFNSVGFYVGPGFFKDLSKKSNTQVGLQTGIEYIYNFDNKFGIFSNLSYTLVNYDTEEIYDNYFPLATIDTKQTGIDLYAGIRYVYPISNSVSFGWQFGAGFRQLSTEGTIDYFNKPDSTESYSSNSRVKFIISPGLAIFYAINPKFDLGLFSNFTIPFAYYESISTVGMQLKLNYNF